MFDKRKRTTHKELVATTCQAHSFLFSCQPAETRGNLFSGENRDSFSVNNDATKGKFPKELVGCASLTLPLLTHYQNLCADLPAQARETTDTVRDLSFSPPSLNSRRL